MALVQLVNSTIKTLTRLLCKVDDAQLAQVPVQGPLILVVNHVNFLDIPLVYTHLQPRVVTGLVKAETWDNPAMHFLFNMWKAIPLRRSEADTSAFRSALAALEVGHILAVAPEGTRSGDGRLQRGHPGVVMLALRTNAPLLPIAYYGGERLRHNLPRLKRTDFRVVVGQPFYLHAEGKVTREVRQQMVDEIMYQLAALLPPAYRGHYSNLSAATERYLRFPPSSISNLQQAGRGAG